MGIDDPKLEIEGTSKGIQLVFFCRHADQATVFKGLNSLRSMAHEAGIEKSIVIKARDVAAFDELSHRTDQRTSGANSGEVVKNVSKHQLLLNVKSNENSSMLIDAIALATLSIFPKGVRSYNFLAGNDENSHTELLTLIDVLMLHIERVLSSLPSGPEILSGNRGDEIASWTQRYINGALPKLGDYFAPERPGRTSGPVAVILACGGLGSLFTRLQSNRVWRRK